MPPTTRLVPSACVHSACARDARRAVSFPNAHSFRKFQASACTVAQRRQAHVGACRAHSLGPRNRLPSSTTHTRAVLLGPPPSVKRRRSQPPSSRMLQRNVSLTSSCVLYRYCTMHTVRKSGARKSSLAAAMLSSFVALHTAAYSACSRVDTCGWRGSGRMHHLPCKWPRRVCSCAR